MKNDNRCRHSVSIAEKVPVSTLFEDNEINKVTLLHVDCAI